MKKVIIYGTAVIGREIYHIISRDGEYEVIAFIDFFTENHNKELFGLKIIAPQEVNNFEYDLIIPASITHYQVIHDELISLYCVDNSKIDISFSQNLKIYSDKARETFLRFQAKVIYAKAIKGNVAEGGVHKGLFASEINRYFYDRKLYLFDTFEGYDKRDVLEEKLSGGYDYAPGYLGDTAVDLVLRKLPFKENAIIKKGYFPETANGIEDSFVFVNLDFNLYNPTLAGLEFFYPKMAIGGVILIHDYFDEKFVGVIKAVDEFCIKHNITPMAIGDLFSCAIIKY